ncbi:MAG: sigma-70 family RNA polymerase sigma factor [Bacteroidales bacterium]|jgi:RNA polymerase sigma-70 factor (ECF subfamily)|nr:sigma-70 family RNA polymerase sigma factor [Bacteroidales bacterium]
MEVNENLSKKAQYDLQLVEAAKTGDEKAFAELMNKYKDAIYFMLLKIVRNEEDADDLTIEAFGKAFNKIGKYTPNFAFSTWLFKIATNNCIDYMRKKRAVTVPIENGDSDYPVIRDLSDQQMNPEEHLIKKQKKKILQSVVDQLKPRYKILVELRYFKEFSYQEIAEELNLPIGTIKAQLYRARELLYQILNKGKKNI